ncbi:hypothetical protein NDI52_10235 [Leptolyngbya sp. PL-A3]
MLQNNQGDTDRADGISVIPGNLVSCWRSHPTVKSLRFPPLTSANTQCD